MRVLKQSTAATVMFGPYLDRTDGYTEETGLAGAGTELSKAGGAFGAGPTLGTHDSDGWYPISLTTTHTNTLGDLTIKGHDNATHLPVWMHFTVVPANAYDAMVSGSGVGMRSDVQGWLGTAPAAVTVAGVPEVDITHIAGAAVNTASAQLGVNMVSGAAGAITATVIATGAIDADAIAADAATEIANAVWDTDATGRQTAGTFGQAIGDPAADANTIYGAVVTGAAGATIAVDIIAVQADTDNIQTRLPAALVSGRMDSDVGAMQAGTVTAAVVATGAIDADALSADAGTELGTAVWATATRSLTVLDEDSTTLDLDATIRAAVGLAVANLDGQLTAIDDFLDTEVAAILADTTQIKADLPARITKNTALAAFPFRMVQSADHVTPATGVAVTATRSLDGAAFAACANAVVEISNGWYRIDLAATDLNANTVALKFTAAATDQVDVTVITEPT